MTELNNDIESKYNKLADKICKEAVLEFKQAKGNREEKRKACCQYFKRGNRAGFSQEELIDFLGISTPSILSLADYTEDEELEIMVLIGEISDSEVANALI